MKYFLIVTISLFLSITLNAQTPGYYNGTENKTGEELKTALHNIIKNHVDFSYSDSKAILNYADEDPDNTNNLIQLYTNRSVSKSSWGTGGDNTNREHVWAKSHGNFADIRPMDGDAHNLHAADASVNITRSNYDFDSVPNGTYIEEADAYYGGGAFEPADRDKGVVARTIFYMAVRYEGTDGELDLKMADKINTADATADHGKLSTLLEWNSKYPPTELERRRNDRVFQSQLNRNPFIDNPNLADLIWANEAIPATVLGDVSIEPLHPTAGQTVTITATLTNANETPTAKLFWGKTFNSETNEIAFTGSNNITAELSLESFTDNEMVFLKIVASTGEVQYSSFVVTPTTNLTEISATQGTGNSTPMENTVVTIAGVVTANFDNSFYMQSGSNIRSGICVYSPWRGRVGDSVAVTGKVVEYQNLTELSNVTMVYSYGSKVEVEPTELAVTELKEDYEGMIIKLSDVNFANADELIPADGGTYTINEGSNTIPVFVRYNSRLTGQRIPNGTVDVTAILSQYGDTYQLLIENINWIVQGIDTTAPTITNVIATDASYIEVSFNEKIEESTISTSSFTIEGLTIEGAYFYPSTKVFLLVSGMQKKEYTIVAQGIEDLYGNTIKEASFTFTSDFGTGIEKENQQSIFSVFPNPNSGDFTLDLSNKSESTWVSIIDLSGRIVYNSILAEGVRKHSMALENSIKKGCYILQIESNGSTQTKKIIIN